MKLRTDKENIFLPYTKYSVLENPQEYTFSLEDQKLASISSTGILVGSGVGKNILKITNKENHQTKSYPLIFKKGLTYEKELPRYQLPEKYLTTIEKSPYTPHQYLGQPDLIQTSTGRLITAYPVGHGKGPIVMRVSDDQGETWQEKGNLPSSWKDSQETPTLYVLKRKSGKEILMLITACPGTWGDYTTGWNTSISLDNGETWSEYKHWYSYLKNGEKNYSVVGMASLIPLKDEKGEQIDRWLGVYHNQEFVNLRTYLTFNEKGEEIWTEPEPYLENYRQQELEYQLCEVGMLRVPNSQRIIGLCRSQSHRHLATLITSIDEGTTWSKPRFLPGSLLGERHKLLMDPVSGKLCISFREIIYDLNHSGLIEDETDWKAGNWCVWVGTLDDLFEEKSGKYLLTMGQDYSPNVKGGDTGYAGVTAFSDGKIVMVSYGHWDEEFSNKWKGDVRTDLCYIKQAKFYLEELEKELAINKI